MALSDRPVCNIRYCHRPPASWILAGFALLEQDGVLRIGRVERFDQFLKQDLYPHNNIIEVEIEGDLLVFDYENGYQSFLRPQLFDTQIERVTAYFKTNFDPAQYEGLRNKEKVHPFIAGAFTATCPGNPYDKVLLSENSLKGYLSQLRHQPTYRKEYDYRRVSCGDSFSEYSLLFWSRLNEEGADPRAMQRTYPFLDDAQAEDLAKRHAAMLRDVNRRRVVICTALKKAFGDRLIGGIADGDFARRHVPELITQDERVSTRSRFLATMQSGVIGVISVGHQYCIGARFGELLACGRAILSDPFRYVLPGECAEGKNYLAFRTADELCAQAEFLLRDTEAVHAMEAQNRQYYEQYFQPRSCVRYALQTAFPSHDGFQITT